MTELAEATKLTLSQTKVADIRARLSSDLIPGIEATEEELAKIGRLTASWRDMPAGVAAVERIADDRRRLENRLAILRDMRQRAEAELRNAEAQVKVDELQDLHGEMELLGAYFGERDR